MCYNASMQELLGVLLEYWLMPVGALLMLLGSIIFEKTREFEDFKTADRVELFATFLMFFGCGLLFNLSVTGSLLLIVVLVVFSILG